MQSGNNVSHFSKNTKNYQDYKNRVIPVIKIKLPCSNDYVTVKSVSLTCNKVQ